MQPDPKTKRPLFRFTSTFILKIIRIILTIKHSLPMMKVSVQSIHFQADAKLVDFIEKKLTRLDRYFDKNRSVEAEVSLKLQDTGGPIHEKIIEIKLLLPGGWLIDKKTGRSFESAVTASADTLKRQLLRHKERTSSIPHIRFSDL